MPIYTVQAPDGRSFDLEGDSPPTEQELEQVFSSISPKPSASAQRAASIEPQIALNEALRQQNLQQIYGAIPFYGAPTAASEAFEGTKQLLGESLPAQVAAVVAGAGGALGTLFNPITKAASNIPRLTQGLSEQLGTLSTGQVASPLAQQTITGERNVQPLVQFSEETPSTVRNLAASIANVVQTEPVNAALMLEGARSPSKVFKGAVELTKQGISTTGDIVSAITPNILKRASEIVTQVPKAFKKNVGVYAQDVFKPTTDTAKIEINRDIESGALHDDLRNIAEFGKPKTAEQMLENGLIAKDNLINLHEDFASQFPTERFSNSDIANSLRQEISSKELATPQERQTVLDFANKIDGERSLQGSFRLLKELNDRRNAFYEKSQKGQATDLDNALNQAEQIARDKLSEKLDNFYRLKTGATDNPYRQYGSLNGRLSDLTLRLNDLLTKRGIEISKGLSLDREVLSTIKRNLSLLKGGEKGRIDNRIARMFDLLGKEEVTNLRDLTTEEIQSLREQQSNLERRPLLQEEIDQLLRSR